MELREDWHKTFDLNTELGKGDPFAAAVRWSRMPMVFADPRQVDTPIVYANAAFCKLTGYELDEIVGRNCRFLQGPETDPETIKLIRTALADRRSIGVDVLNYRKDGSSYWNALFISPVVNEQGDLLYFFSSQFDATERLIQARIVEDRKRHLENEVGLRTRDLESTLINLEAALNEKTLLIHEIDHRVKNNLQTISTLIALQARTVSDPGTHAVLKSLQDRVDALGAVHRRLYKSGSALTFDLSELVRELVPEIVKGHARGRIEIVSDLQPVVLDGKSATPISLIINELVTNAVRHAWTEGEAGTLWIRTEHRSREAILSIIDNGAGLPAQFMTRPMSGLKLTSALVRQLRGTLKWSETNQGTAVEVGVPFR